MSLLLHLSFPPAHAAALNRQRRIFFQYDPAADIQQKGGFGSDMDALMGYVFDFADMPGSQLDAICIDVCNEGVAHFRSKILPAIQHPGLMKWREQGLDYFDELIKQGHKRGKEIWWGLRMNEVERGDLAYYEPGRWASNERNPVKAAHPEWLIRSWWWQGFWNYAVKEVRDYRLSIVREVAEQYDFDGVHLDFLRHTPFLPPGKQWENREHLTSFMRDVRSTLQAQATKRGRPFLLAARVPDSIEGCHIDGFDIETWAREGLVDVLILGTRSINVDVTSFRKAMGGAHVKLIATGIEPDQSTDGYQGEQPLDLVCGVFGNYLYQGADGVGIFNNPAGSAEHAAKIGLTKHEYFNPEIFTTIGSLQTMEGKERFYPIERRGGYACVEGYGSSNNGAPLPIELRNDQTQSTLKLPVWEPVKTGTEVRLRLVLFQHVELDEVAVLLNGIALKQDLVDAQWKDARIFSPNPQPNIFRGPLLKNTATQKLTRIEFIVPVERLKRGNNSIAISVDRKGPFPACSFVKVEKIELHLK